MRTGISTVPLDYGKCPKWLFERMKKLSQGIMLAIREEFGPEEILKRLSNPVWFQSLGCVIGFDWNSSGLTTTTMAALKEGLRGIEKEIGVFICGGKGKTSRKTPQQIQKWGESLRFPNSKVEKLIYVSKMAAKVDTSCIQDGFQIYSHNLIFSFSGEYAVVQQGMNINARKARRYHWLSHKIKNLVEEPHSGIIAHTKTQPLNLTAKKSRKNRRISVGLAIDSPKTFLKDIKLISRGTNSLFKKKEKKGFTELELNNIEFRWHPVIEEKFNLKRLEKVIFLAGSEKPQTFEKLLSLPGIGPRTIRALSLVAEIIYGAKPSYEDPARYSFAHGGKDATPFPVDCLTYDKTIELLDKGIRKGKVSLKEKEEARRRLERIIVN